MPILPTPILLIRPRLQLILIRGSNRRRTPHPLQLTLHIIADMFFVLGVGRAPTATGRATGFLVVEDGRCHCGRGVARDGGVVVASVADGAGCGGAADGGAAGEAGSAGAGEDVVEVVRGCDEGGAGSLGEAAVYSVCC